MNKQQITAAITSVVAGLSLFALPVHADMCTTQYGGTTTCNPSDLTINKKVLKPVVAPTPTETSKGGVISTPTPTPTPYYVENLTTTDPTFGPGANVSYRLTIHNGSGQTFQANVKDILPPYLEFVSGPGTYNKDTRVLEFKLENLIAGETRDIDILAKVVAADKMPAGKSLFCVVNVAEVRALNRFDSDSAQVCLQNGDVAVTKLPVAGFEDMTLLLPFAGVMLGGFALLKGKKTV